MQIQLNTLLPGKKRDKQYCRITFEHKVKGYQKLTLITAIFGLVVLVPIIVGYVYFNSLIGFPILGLFLGGILLHVFVLLLVNAASLYVAFRIKNTKMASILLIVCGVVILAAATYFGIPSFVLFCIAGVLALKEKQTLSSLIQKKTRREVRKEKKQKSRLITGAAAWRRTL